MNNFDDTKIESAITYSLANFAMLNDDLRKLQMRKPGKGEFRKALQKGICQ